MLSDIRFDTLGGTPFLLAKEKKNIKKSEQKLENYFN